MKAYRAIREKHGLIEMFKNSELAAEVTLQPVRAFSVDAAIIFADILLPLEGMGIKLDFIPHPAISNPVRNRADVDALRLAVPEEDLGYVLKSIRFVREELHEEAPLIGFAGAPFTLACYAIEGGTSSNCLMTKEFMRRAPEAWDLLMKKLCRTIIDFLKAQILAGAQIVQLFDSWVGHLSPSDYKRFVLPYSRLVFSELSGEGVPLIHFGTGTAGLLSLMTEAGGDVIGADWRISLSSAWSLVGDRRGIQGNLDPALLLAPIDDIKQGAAEILDEANGCPGHIFNLGHGILPSTPEDSVKALADFVHDYTSKRN
jgi:uroporphyrinogen decarboxylase